MTSLPPPPDLEEPVTSTGPGGRAVSPGYSFRGTWTVPAPPPRVREVLVDLERYPEWWPQVLAVVKITDDDARVLCRSVLPYTLDLVLHAERREQAVLETSLAGDLEGVVRWRLFEGGGGTRMEFEQDVRVTGRLLGLASGLVRPVLHWNHDRMMAGCLDGLSRRLAVGCPPRRPRDRPGRERGRGWVDQARSSAGR